MLVLVNFLGKRADWARIVVTVLGVLNVLGLLTSLGQSRPIFFTLVSLIQTGVLLGAIYFLYRLEANAYFKWRG